MTSATLVSVLALVLAAASVWVSVRATRNLLNGYVIANLLRFATIYIIPAVAPLFIDIELPVSTTAWTFAMVAQTGEILGYLAGLNRVPSARFAKLPEIPPQRLKTVAILSFAAYAVTFAPILIPVGIVAAFRNPRAEIYEVTRSGFGQFYFVSGSFLTLFCLLGLFAFRRKWIVILIGTVASIPYGNKTRFFILANILLTYYLFFHPVQKYLRRPVAVAATGVLLLALIPVAFWVTSYDLELNELHQFVLGFGVEFQVNFSILAKDFASYFPGGFFGGRIFLEDNLLAFAPRFLWPGKPQFFGALHLADTVFPVLTALEQGAPSFGPFGQPYADFGNFGLMQVIAEHAFLGYVLGRCEAGIRVNDARSFLLLYTAITGGFVSVGGLNPTIAVLLNLAVIAVLFKILRYESPRQPAAMPS